MQSNNIDFKSIWKEQKTANPSMQELKGKIQNFNRKNYYKIVLVNILFFLTSIVIFYIWYYFNPKLLTTKIGIVLCFIAMLFFIYFYNKIFILFKKLNEFESNKDYLKDLITLKQKQKYIQTRILSIYFILLSLGIGLYMYEYTLKMSVFWKIFSYTIIICWVFFNWFYLRPKIAKKEQQKIKKIIVEYKRINTELNE